MRAVLTNFGTTGDVQPFLALAVELARNGHQPLVALSPYFENWVKRMGLEFVSIGEDLSSAQREINAAMIEGEQTAERLHELFGALRTSLPRAYAELLEVCRGADALICGPVQPAGKMVHEVTGIPFVSVQVANFGGGGTHPFQRATQSFINPFRAQMGLPPLRDPLTVDANSSQLALYAVSRYLYPPPANRPGHYHVVGYFFLDDEKWQPDSSLLNFLEAGEPPVVVTFGSTTYNDSGKVAEKVIEAINTIGCRAIIQHGWSGLAQGLTLPPNILTVGVVPHEWLFARAACIVHHGGAGTAASVFRAGIPSVFVTHAGGQPLRARLAHELGCSGPAVPYQGLSAARLAAAIQEILSNQNYRQAALALSEKIRTEQGVKRARLLIEQLVHRMGLCADDDGADGSSVARNQTERLRRRNVYIQKRRPKPLV